jgi:hypothetical protein
MDAIVARWHGYRLDGALFCAVFRGVFPAFCDERSDGPYLTIFGYHGTQILHDGGYRPHDDGSDAKRCGPTENDPDPHPPTGR